MTRVNCIPVSELCDQHLVAEWREIPRVISAMAKKSTEGANVPTIPPTYRMGRGHVTFFYNKLTYILNRLADIRIEMLFRNMKPSSHLFALASTNYHMVPKEYRQSWSPTSEAQAINRARIAERLATMSRVTYTNRRAP